MNTPLRIECFAEIPAKPEMVVISGASGAGKGTIVRKVMELSQGSGEKRSLSVSWTSRQRRADDKEGDYNYVSREEFEQMIEEGGFLEWAEFNGNYYGTPCPTNSTGQLIVEIETNGAEELRQKTLDQPGYAQFQYVLAATPSQLETQLFGRSDGLDLEEKKNRIKIFYQSELAKARTLGAHVIINTNPDLAAHKSLAAANGIFFCDPTLASVIDLYEEDQARYLAEAK